MEEQRTIVKFYVRLGKSIEEVTNDLVKVYEEKAMAPRTIRKWVTRFKEGRQSTEDDQREGSTTQNQIEEVQRMVNDDPKITIRTISRELNNISLGSVVSILHKNLNTSKVSARWVLQLLTMVHRQARIELCNHFINMFDRDPEQFILENYNQGWNVAIRLWSSHQANGDGMASQRSISAGEATDAEINQYQGNGPGVLRRAGCYPYWLP